MVLNGCCVGHFHILASESAFDRCADSLLILQCFGTVLVCIPFFATNEGHTQDPCLSEKLQSQVSIGESKTKILIHFFTPLKKEYRDSLLYANMRNPVRLCGLLRRAPVPGSKVLFQLPFSTPAGLNRSGRAVNANPLRNEQYV
jgi:hypothetical protein